MGQPRPFADLASSGLLWLINASVFHPRGFALTLHVDRAGAAAGWSLQGDGSEPWHFDGPRDKKFAAVEATLRAVREANSGGDQP